MFEHVTSLVREIDRHLARVGAAHEELRCLVCRAVSERARSLVAEADPA